MPAVTSKCDAVVGALDSEAVLSELTESLLQALVLKGFCVLDLSGLLATTGESSEELLKAAEAEVRTLERGDRFAPPPKEVLAGLLGEEGSSLVCEIDTGLAAEEAECADGATLQKLDSVMSTLALLLEPSIESRMGLAFKDRSAALLHIASDMSDEEPVELTEAVADDYLSLFLNQQLMIVLCMGPAKAELELQPFGLAEATKAYEVSLAPGMAVVLRADLLSHRLTANSRSVAMSCFLLRAAFDTSQKRSLNGSLDAPVTQTLIAWVGNRLKELKEAEVMGDDGQEWDAAIPRSWQSAMNNAYAKGRQVAMLGTACRMVSAWDSQELWCGSVYGSDLITEIPFKRWNYEHTYDPNMQSWKYNKSFVKHGSFMDGTELFDNKLFGLAAYECKAMDPCQRVVLECGYECMVDAGYNKKKLMRSLIGVYIGLSISEMTMVECDGEQTGTSTAGSITSNRISFCLGMQGPSYSIDLGGAASHAAIQQGQASLRYQTEAYMPNHTAMAGGIMLRLSAQFDVLHCAAGLLCPDGRCFTFNTGATGWARGEGAGCVCLSNMVDFVDGNPVVKYYMIKKSLGTVCAANLNHTGKGAHICAPHGVQEKELLAGAVRQASLSPLDVDWVECNGEGAIMMDAVECACLNEVYRSRDTEETLAVGSTKTDYGYLHETAGMPQLFRILFGQKYGVMTPMNHLVELNPYIEVFDERAPLAFTTEALGCKNSSSFAGMTGRSLTGSQCHIILWGEIDQEQCLPRKVVKRESIVFWPAGGGELPAELEGKTYSILGSWTAFSTVEPMEKEEEGIYGFTVTLGVNCFERFHIVMDGKRSKVLHPGTELAPQNVPVLGPDTGADAEGFGWIIDGRAGPMAVAAPKQSSLALPINDEELAEMQSPELWYVEPPPGQEDGCATPGDRYRVRLRVAGQWRTVDWQKVEPDPDFSYTDGGSYSVAGSWSDWSFEEMKSSGNGVYTLDVKTGGSFVIVRDEDWNQVFCPAWDDTGTDTQVEGPDSWSDACWNIPSSWHRQLTHRIEFTRTFDATTGMETKALSFREK
jgi:polyketide synthase-associated protein